jgi:hypothetical protein
MRKKKLKQKTKEEEGGGKEGKMSSQSEVSRGTTSIGTGILSSSSS